MFSNFITIIRLYIVKTWSLKCNYLGMNKTLLYFNSRKQDINAYKIVITKRCTFNSVMTVITVGSNHCYGWCRLKFPFYINRLFICIPNEKQIRNDTGIGKHIVMCCMGYEMFTTNFYITVICNRLWKEIVDEVDIIVKLRYAEAII